MQTFNKKALTADEERFCRHIMAADAFAALVINDLTCKNNVTCVRASDGERALIAHALYGTELTPFLRDDIWLTKYGVKGANMQELGNMIFTAGNRATYLAPTISGLWLPQFKVDDMFHVRDVYVDIFYPYNWGRTRMSVDKRETSFRESLVGVLNAADKVFLAYHGYTTIIGHMKASGQITSELCGYPLTSWTQHEAVLDAVVREKPDLVLVCGGPHGKVLVDKVGQLTDKPHVTLDVGSAVENAW